MDQLKDILGAGFGEKVLDYMKELAKGLGVAAEHVYEVLVRQQLAFGIASMVGWGITLLICMYCTYKFTVWMIRTGSWEHSPAFMIIVPALIGLGFGLFNGFLHVFNPEYYAIQEVISAITVKK